MASMIETKTADAAALMPRAGVSPRFQPHRLAVKARGR